MENVISSITASQSRFLNEVVLDLLLEAEASAVILCDHGGNILTNTSWSEDAAVDTFSALAAGAFAATQELATMNGEAQFNSVWHEGETVSVYIQRVAEDFLLIVRFNKSTTLGLVKLYADKATQSMLALLSVLSLPGATQPHGMARFELQEESNLFRLSSVPNG